MNKKVNIHNYKVINVFHWIRLVSTSGASAQ